MLNYLSQNDKLPLKERGAFIMSDKAKVCKINTDEARDSAIEFGINAIPTTKARTCVRPKHAVKPVNISLTALI